MHDTDTYESPLGPITLAADEEGLTGLWFEGQKYYAAGLEPAHQRRENPVFAQTRQWLDAYFQGADPGPVPPLHLIGSPFRRSVWEVMLQIPYGRTMTYREIGQRLCGQRGARSAQAVGGAVAHNPISILVPCHRVVGTGGSLTGYAGGLSRKMALLRLEGADLTGLYVPKHGTAL